MNPKIYSQSSAPWGSLPYPDSSSPVSTDGCGLLAVTHCAIERVKYWNAIPKTFYTFMKKYAVSGNGTLWDGIDAGLKNYVGNAKRFDSMQPFFAEAKQTRAGVILFRSGSAPDGTVWTTSGHYVAFTNYKEANGKHYLYTKDSGGRHHDGWHAYEDSMRGCIRLLWTVEVNREGWLKDSKGWVYHDHDGNTVKSKWIKWKDEWYYLKADGYMATSEWVKDPKGWCYVGKDGKMLKGKWLRWKNNFYYLDGKGYMVTGERNVPCTFDDKGRMVAE